MEDGGPMAAADGGMDDATPPRLIGYSHGEAIL